MKIRSLLFVTMIIVALSGCRNEPASIWSPALEEIDYGYLRDKAEQALEDLRELEVPGQGTRALDDARQHLLALRDYFIPLTGVRQLMIDADRHGYNGQFERAKKRLYEARAILLTAADTAPNGVKTALMEAVALCDDLLHRLDLDERPARPEFEALIHKINLMLTRGDLVIAGNRFTL